MLGRGVDDHLIALNAQLMRMLIGYPFRPVHDLLKLGIVGRYHVRLRHVVDETGEEGNAVYAFLASIVLRQCVGNWYMPCGGRHSLSIGNQIRFQSNVPEVRLLEPVVMKLPML